MSERRADQATRHYEQLCTLWPTMTTKSVVSGPLAERTVVVLHSVGFEFPPHLQHVVPAYEERFLCAILSLLRQPRGRIIYLTSLPMLPRLVDYYLGLAPALHSHDMRDRLRLISVGDGSLKTLTRKIIERPRLIERIGASIPDKERAVILPFITSEDEITLSYMLDVPCYGHDPRLGWIGTKTGGRRIFAEEGIPCAPGVDGVKSLDDVVEAIRELNATTGADAFVVKLDAGAGGLGNATVRLRGAAARQEIADAVRDMELDDKDETTDWYLDNLAQQGGVVEVMLSGEEIRSPSAQLRIDPEGRVEILSTHDQILGGSNGLTFLGCRFPADPAYAGAITDLAMTIGRRVGNEGALGRLSIDFVTVRSGDTWTPYALEINLRSGGTTHPLLTLLSLTDGDYDPDTATFRVPDGREKFYVASDHVEGKGYERLTPDDLLDLAESELRWDEQALTGVAFHFVSAIASAGRTGVTVIGDSASDAMQRYKHVVDVLDRESGARV
ncbi:MAG: hypothetical protein WAT66_07115 [Actinomycetota bacterium]